MKWIVVANSNDGRIYEYDHRLKTLYLVEELMHPENRLKTHELITDRPGHYKSRSVNRGAYVPETNAHDEAIDEFARELAQRLNAGRVHHAYDDVVLMMPSTMEGLLLKHLNKQVLGSIHQVIQKNMMHLSEHELTNYLLHVVRRGPLH